jgi:folate-binding protein YgfZ
MVHVKLPNRAEISVQGDDKYDFLQGLITQDIHLLKKQPLIYAFLLTPQGKFLHDFFMREDGEAIKIDCEGGERAEALLNTLTKYKLRSKVTLELIGDCDVWQIWGSDKAFNDPDPRGEICGYRSYQQPENSKEVDFDDWDYYRISHAIPDGSRDFIPEKSFIHEGRADVLNGVSYDKGCYVGQELVSRMHHRGLIKKTLQCVQLDAIPDGADLRSTCRNKGLALVRH